MPQFQGGHLVPSLQPTKWTSPFMSLERYWDPRATDSRLNMMSPTMSPTMATHEKGTHRDPAVSVSVLFRLPLELRTMIYRLVFGYSKPLISPHSRKEDLGGPRRLAADPQEGAQAPLVSGILLTCHQVYDEARYELTKLNTFRLSLLNDDSVIVRMYTPHSNFSTITRLELFDGTRPTVPGGACSLPHPMSRLSQPGKLHGLLKYMNQLKSLVLDCQYTSFDPWFATHSGLSNYIRAKWGEAICTDIGVYQLQGPFSVVQLRHWPLVSLWPVVRQSYDGMAVLNGRKERRDYFTAFISHIGYDTRHVVFGCVLHSMLATMLGSPRLTSYWLQELLNDNTNPNVLGKPFLVDSTSSPEVLALMTDLLVAALHEHEFEKRWCRA